VSTIEHLTEADHAAVGCLLLEAYADYAARIGPDAWMRLQDGLAQAREWASLRLLGVARSARGRGLSRRLTEWCIERARQQGATEIGLHTSEAMTTARGLYERMGFVVDGDLPMNFGLRYWRFRRSLGGG
jgi:GNAT superfamily N-acetyltransferase